ncbi:MAG: ribosome biogenesis factor YjgA [Sutterellaceae bacterium]|nr:DUF615 domain-containing protein [Burkholderiaceae bacterium]MCX7901544.1 DUF615 domain-containing protein [Burkholderiaceae bacterium]MDW8430541.1 ribosome biogenesis factor YjgA [Sutterellaceae bacterium]
MKAKHNHALPAPLPEKPSKTQRKRQMHELQALGEALLRLPAAQREQLDLPEALREAFAKAAHITAHEARRRHLQYIGRLMRSVDPEPLWEAVAAARGASRAVAARMRRCEQLRDALLADDRALTSLLAAQPQLDAQRLRATIRAARKERAAGQPPHHAGALYRMLHDTLGHSDESATTASG